MIMIVINLNDMTLDSSFHFTKQHPLNFIVLFDKILV